MNGKQKGGAEYQDFFLDPFNGSVYLNRSLEDNELVQPVILVVKVYIPLQISVVIYLISIQCLCQTK